jgi:hypothetical protein
MQPYIKETFPYKAGQIKEHRRKLHPITLPNSNPPLPEYDKLVASRIVEKAAKGR